MLDNKLIKPTTIDDELLVPAPIGIVLVIVHSNPLENVSPFSMHTFNALLK